MPFSNPIVAMRLLDNDEGDDLDFTSVADDLMDYLSSRLMAFQFSDHSRKKDQCIMTFRNEDFAMFDRPVFTRGQKFLLTWGWPGRTAPPRRMIVKHVRGGAEILVTAHDTVSLLDQKKKLRFMPGVTDAEWVRAIADEYRYTGTLSHIETTKARRDITQPRWMTDARMLAKLARRNGFEFYIDSTGLHWHKKPTNVEPVVNFYYARDPGQGTVLEAPKFDANLSKGVSRVRVLSRDPILKTYIDHSSGLSDETDVSLGQHDELFDPDEDDESLRGNRIGMEQVVSAGLMNDEEAKSLAEGVYRETAQKRYKTEFPIIGDARVGAKQIVGLWGDVSQTMAGLYYVHKAVTQITPGNFTMTLYGRKDSLQEVKASRTRRPRNNVNQKAKSTATVTDKSDKMKLLLVGVTLPSGEVVPGQIWTDDDGKTGITRQLTDEEFTALSEQDKNQLRYSLGAVSFPDP